MFLLILTLFLLIIPPSFINSTQELELEQQAIRVLHAKLDFDADGEVDDSESQKYLESDDNSKNTGDKLRYLHQDDKRISADELYQNWKTSEVHGWSTDDVIYWLETTVELPEYSQLFQQNSINGSLLLRLAADPHFISKLGITEPSAKSKISIKAMDAVFFGPPKSGKAKIRDIIVSIVTLIAISSCYIFYSRLCASQKTLKTMQDSLETLQRAEDQMLELQQELNKALKAQEAVVTEKRNLEHQLEMQRQFSASSISDQSRSIGSAGSNSLGSTNSSNKHNSNSDNSSRDLHTAKLELELKNLRKELQETYDSMNAKKFRAPFSLRTLLQTTYDIESQYYNEKKLNLESKATEVKLRNQKLQKKKTSFLGYYKMAQENSLEEDINTIVEVKEAIMQVTKEIKERSERWRAIEEHCGCSFIDRLS